MKSVCAKHTYVTSIHLTGAVTAPGIRDPTLSMYKGQTSIQKALRRSLLEQKTQVALVDPEENVV